MKREKKAYMKPEVRRIRLSLSEVTLATGCWATAQLPYDNGHGGCEPASCRP
jgi:hypothetical protein